MEGRKNGGPRTGVVPSSSSIAPPRPPSPRIPRRSIGGAPAVAAFANNYVTGRATGGNATAQPSTTVRRVVPRPPINVYLRIPIIRHGEDSIVCEDPENPGGKKSIIVSQLAGGNEAVTDANAKEDELPGQSSASRNDGPGDDNNLKSKKEIPVPTITTVRHYDTNVLPNFVVPESYVRNICPTYNEVLECTVDYNIDAEDERWWRNNGDFGPYAKARIILEDESLDRQLRAEDGKKNELDTMGGDSKTTATGAGSEKEVIYKGKIRNKKGKFVKKITSKKTFDDDDLMEAEETNTVWSSPRSSTPTHNYTIDQVLLLNPRYLNSMHSSRYLLQKYNPKLPLKLFERMMDILDKVTGFESIVTNTHAEEILVKKMPQLIEIFGPLSAEDWRQDEEEEEMQFQRLLKGDDTLHVKRGNNISEQAPLPMLVQPGNLHALIAQVYGYWVSKRSRLRRPLLRRHCPPTPAADTNPHQVFRQRDREKRRLRKKKQNDMEAYKKMIQLKLDFERVRVLCDLTIRRENVNATLVELTDEYFEERLFCYLDTTGVPRRSLVFGTEEVERALNVPKYFDNGPIVKLKGSKKRKRPSHQLGWNAVDRRDPLPVPHAHHAPNSISDAPRSGPGNVHPPLTLPNRMTSPPPMATILAPQNIVVAGVDAGFPAPNFLQPLATRRSNTVTNWEDAAPSVPSYVNGQTTKQTDKFCHRPRLGRGGRIVIDRVPCPSHDVPPIHDDPLSISPTPMVITYGSSINLCGYDVSTLGADGPNYSINPSPEKYGLIRSPVRKRGYDGRLVIAAEEGMGTDAASAPKAPPAWNMLDLLPKSPDNLASLSHRIEEICALALVEECRGAANNAAIATAPSSLSKGISSLTGMLEEDTDEVLVSIEDWMDAPGGARIYGFEKFAIGPL